jgi:hypothetical protein
VYSVPDACLGRIKTLLVRGKELGMGIESQSKWRHRQKNSFFAALFPFFLFVNYSSEHKKEALRKQS